MTTTLLGATDKPWEALREKMVRQQIRARGVKDPRVLKAMEEVPRHEFIPEDKRKAAYVDAPIPIGYQQTISQPYIVAFMTEASKVKATDRVLEIGTGSGYQSAVLAKLAKEVYSIEILAPLAKQARTVLLNKLNFSNIHLKQGDGFFGWKDAAPFDVIIVTAAPKQIPDSLKRQLKLGGRLIVPVGENWQELTRLTKIEGGFQRESLLPVRFVPMTGAAQK